MSVLIVGDDPRTAGLIRNLLPGAEEGEVTQCSPSEVTSGLASGLGERFDWVLLESSGRPGECLGLARAIHAAGTQANLVLFRHLDASAGDLAAARPMVCAIERDDDGLQMLRCALRAAEPGAGVLDPLAREATQEQAHIFEYHAPTRRSG